MGDEVRSQLPRFRGQQMLKSATSLPTSGYVIVHIFGLSYIVALDILAPTELDMCVCLSVDLKDLLVSQLHASGFRNPKLIKSYIRRGLAMGYGTYKFVQYFKWYGVPCARILNTNSRKKRREHCSRKLKKRRRKEERLSFSRTKNRQDLVRFSVRQIHV